ncbi:hypothetical protein [Micrococcus sp. FDAARGOS_333]|uniref:hypothetical protein n=1 Tax=Micrococcus sp. FDAARGOS_333 TaxID=1930558 RepID=UPI000B4E00EB|nr:hypothetical protein [Micrococcus sp. FDAARGOS_333]PNL17297.1 hypothetical protein CEQ11_003335 [Micrococcus sp. FDAARGOS_333]
MSEYFLVRPESELNFTQAAKVAGVSYSTFRSWVQDGRVPVIQMGEKIRRVRYADALALRRRTGPEPSTDIDPYIEAVVAAAPQLTEGQLDRLRAVTNGGVAA